VHLLVVPPIGGCLIIARGVPNLVRADERRDALQDLEA
jgi:hypothetical protein